MKRSRKIILVSHCILNSNSKVEGLSEYAGVFYEVVNLINDSGIGIIQLPCPEMLMYGIKRWGHVKEQFDTPYYREKCRKIIQPIISQVKDYQNNDYDIIGVLGVDGSPSCGVNKTCSGNWGGELYNNEHVINKINNITQINESGVFIEGLKSGFKENNIEIPFIAIDENNITSNIDKISNFIKQGGAI